MAEAKPTSEMYRNSVHFGLHSLHFCVRCNKWTILM